MSNSAKQIKGVAPMFCLAYGLCSLRVQHFSCQLHPSISFQPGSRWSRPSVVPEPSWTLRARSDPGFREHSSRLRCCVAVGMAGQGSCSAAAFGDRTSCLGSSGFLGTARAGLQLPQQPWHCACCDPCVLCLLCLTSKGRGPSYSKETNVFLSAFPAKKPHGDN